MTPDWNQVITDFDNKPITLDDNTELTLGRAATIALTLQSPKDQDMSGDDRFNLGRIANKITHNEKITVSELALAKDRIGKTYTPAVVYKAWNMIDPPDEQK